MKGNEMILLTLLRIDEGGGGELIQIIIDLLNWLV